MSLVNLSNFTITSSLQLMLNIILSAHFPSETCIIYTYKTLYFDYSFSSSTPTIPQYVNPTKCISSCDYQIIHDPITTNLTKTIEYCLIKNKNYTFKGVVFLSKYKMDDYKFKKYKNEVPSYAGNAIFIQKQKDYFVISAFKHWIADDYVVLNRWSISENKFENDTFDEYFSDERKKRYRGSIAIGLDRFEFIPFHLKKDFSGSEVKMVMAFAEIMNMNVTWDNDFYIPDRTNNPIIFPKFLIGRDIAEHNERVHIRASLTKLSFLVPKPTSYISWTQLLRVLPLKLWLLIISVFGITAVFFTIENRLFTNSTNPSVVSLVGLFFLQGISSHDIPHSFFAKLLFLKLLILAVLYSSIFSSGIVGELLTETYENDIRTWEDLANSNLSVEWIADPLGFYEESAYTIAEKRAFARHIKPNMSIPWTQKAIHHYITPTKMTTGFNKSPRDSKFPWEGVKSMDDVLVGFYSAISLPTRRNHYMLLMPFLKYHLMICDSVGLMSKWEWDAYYLRIRVDTILKYLDTKPPKYIETKILKIDHVLGVFGLWLIGIVGSLVVFWIEYIYVLNIYNNMFSF